MVPRLSRWRAAMDADTSILLVILAKRPKMGVVKTRLAAEVGPAEALRVYERLLQQQLAHARAFVRLGEGRFVRVDWDVAGAPAERSIAETGWFEDGCQDTGSIGDRMAGVVRRHFDYSKRSADRLLIIGSDCPYLNENVLASAGEAMNDASCVFVPAVDGGYVLIGMDRRFHASGCDVFDGMPWSRPNLMDATRRRLQESAIPLGRAAAA